MERMYLTKSEKRTLRGIKECGGKSVYVSAESYYLDVLSLQRKGLAANPRLRNPTDWTMIASIAACVAAVSATLALFVSCI